MTIRRIDPIAIEYSLLVCNTPRRPSDPNVCISFPHHKLETKSRTPSKELDIIVLGQQTVLSPSPCTRFTAWPPLESLRVFSGNSTLSRQAPVMIVNMHCLLTRKVRPTVRIWQTSSPTSQGGSPPSTGKAYTTASAAKPERRAKREKRIVIEPRIGPLEVRLSAWCIGPVNRTHLYLSSARDID